MRADVAVLLIAGRGAMMRRAYPRRAGGDGASGGIERTPGPNGTTFTRITSMDALRDVIRGMQEGVK